MALTAYVSSQLDLLYRDGGFYENAERVSELEHGGRVARFITDIGELFPSFVCSRSIGGRFYGDPNFLAGLIGHYEWINSMFQRGASTRIVRLTDVYLHQNVLYSIVDDTVLTLYETARSIDRPYSDQTRWTPSQVRSLAVEFRRDHPCLYIGSAGWFNYGHWLVDDLPRAAGAAIIAKHTGSLRVDIIIPDYSPVLNEVKRQTLQHIGVQCDVRFVPQDRFLYFNELYFVTPVSYHPTVKSPEACTWVHTLGRSAVPAAAALPTSSKIYVVRSAAHGRDIVNQDAVTRVFQLFGFEVVDVEGLSFAQQVSKFKNAQIVAGCMGAAMTNTLFCESGTRVLHLAPEGWMEPFYWDLACTCRHSYSAFFGMVSDPLAEVHRAAFIVDVDRLVAALRNILVE